MKIEDIKKITPISKDALRPLKQLSEKERESMHYCDIADSQLDSLC